MRIYLNAISDITLILRSAPVKPGHVSKDAELPMQHSLVEVVTPPAALRAGRPRSYI
jgi:hypothetical protein